MKILLTEQRSTGARYVINRRTDENRYVVEWRGNDIAIARENAHRLAKQHDCELADTTLVTEKRVLMNGPGRQAMRGYFGMLTKLLPGDHIHHTAPSSGQGDQASAMDAIAAAQERRAKRAAKRIKR